MTINDAATGEEEVLSVNLTDYGYLAYSGEDMAAREYGRMQEVRPAMGMPLSTEDGMIAAICSTNRATLATRNGEDFVGLDLVDPWSEEH